MGDLKIEKTDSGVVFVAKIVPGSSRTAVSGVLDGKLKVKVAAAAEKGKANQCLVRFLAEELGVKEKAIRLISGTTKPIKRVEVQGISAEEVLEKLRVSNTGNNI